MKQAEIKQFLTFRLSRIQAKLNSQASAVLKAHSDLSLVEWRVLSLVANFEKSTSAELAKEAEIDKGLFSRNLKRLVSSGYIRITPDVADQRRQILSLKKKGSDTYTALIKIMRKRQKFLIAEFNPDEMKAMRSALQKLDRASERRHF